MYAGTICDARFSKCCGGAFEEFQNCWENVKAPFISSVNGIVRSKTNYPI